MDTGRRERESILYMIAKKELQRARSKRGNPEKRKREAFEIVQGIRRAIRLTREREREQHW
jgi:hypothetical protein